MKRRKFLKNTALSTIASSTLLTACTSGETKKMNVITSDKKQVWKMISVWSKKLPVLGKMPQKLADILAESSGGRLTLEIEYKQKPDILKNVFEKTSKGEFDLCLSTAMYWAKKIPSATFFTAIPFGMNTQQTNAWLVNGKGQEMWQKIYADYKLLPFVAGNTGSQMAGWFRKEIKTVKDFEGMKVKVPELAAKVLEKLGAEPKQIPVNKLYENLEKEELDIAEVVSPAIDLGLKLYEQAPYYYFPAWQEPAPALEVSIHLPSYQKLAKDLQVLVENALMMLNVWTLAEFEAKNSIALNQISQKTKIRQLPKNVLKILKEKSKEVLEEFSAKDKQSKEVYEAYQKFRSEISAWSEVTEKPYYQNISTILG